MKEKRVATFFVRLILSEGNFFNICDLSQFNLKLSEYLYFYISKNIISNSFLLVFKILENHQCDLP